MELQVNIWEELVRIREVMALDSYTRMMIGSLEEMEKTNLEDLPLDRMSDHLERRMAVAAELDECRIKMMVFAFPDGV